MATPRGVPTLAYSLQIARDGFEPTPTGQSSPLEPRTIPPLTPAVVVDDMTGPATASPFGASSSRAGVASVQLYRTTTPNVICAGLPTHPLGTWTAMFPPVS